MTPTIPPPKRNGGRGKLFATGCAALILFLALGGYLTYRGVKFVFARLVEQYTDTRPSALPTLNVSSEQAQAVCARVDAFHEAVRTGKAVKPLILTANDINGLIQHHPSWKKLVGKVYVTIDDNRIRGQVSIPLGEISPRMKGRYLNGSGAFTVQLTDGRLLVFIEALEVKGTPLPKEFMRSLRQENLAQKANMDEETSKVIAKFDSITVQNGQLRIVPKKPD